ncbi:hypothetical protein HPB51_017654 [Rhipicephalus microplus]|uniref:Uncharacterized protein n=1 Tax=Rhipicephalus microplus TaxID=6941 RepID=A0A9J6E3B7_RHIMP|nr:hypothetical protein HPB51_017654 [Rhipicephalus microplus]
MGLTSSIIITFGQATVPRRIVYGGGLHLCTPSSPRVETFSNCRIIGHCTDVCIQPRSQKRPRCSQLHQKEANPKCTSVCIILRRAAFVGCRECEHRHLPKVTRCRLERYTQCQQRVDHTIPESSAQRTEQLPNLRDGHSKSSNRPTWDRQAEEAQGDQRTIDQHTTCPGTP